MTMIQLLDTSEKHILSIEKLENGRFCAHYQDNCRLISKEKIIQIIEKLKDLIK